MMTANIFVKWTQKNKNKEIKKKKQREQTKKVMPSEEGKEDVYYFRRPPGFIYCLSHSLYFLVRDAYTWVFIMGCTCPPNYCEANKVARWASRTKKKIGLTWFVTRMPIIVTFYLLTLVLFCFTGGYLASQHLGDSPTPQNFANSVGYPDTPKESIVVLVGYKNNSGIEVIDKWLSTKQPLMPYVRIKTHVVNDVQSVICEDKVSLTMQSLKPHLVVMSFREPVSAVARFVRMEDSEKLSHLMEEGHWSIQELVGAGFTERVSHELASQIKRIHDCDSSHDANDEAIFSSCYVPSFCLSSSNHSFSFPPFIMMGMYDYIYQLWKKHSQSHLIAVAHEELYSDDTSSARYLEQMMVERISNQTTSGLYVSGLLENVLRKEHKREDTKGDLEHLPRRLRQRLYTFYQYHMQRMSMVSDTHLYTYKTTNRIFKPFDDVIKRQ
jgi:hypothetical protein